MRLLGGLARPVHRRSVGQIQVAEPPRHPGPRLGLGLLGHPHRVGAHVGDQAHRALRSELDALVELLGQHHRLLGREVELAAGVLLQGGRDERRGRVAPPLAPGHRLHPPLLAVEGGHHRERLGLRGQVGLLAAYLAQGRLELRRLLGPEASVERPVLGRDEGLDLALALGDQAHRHRLHPPRREAAPDLVPEQGRELVADEPVQDAARLLRVDLVGVDLSRVLERLLHRPLRDLVEQDAVDLGALDPELLGKVPADGLALAVGVGGDVEGLGLLGRPLQLVQHLLLGGQHAVVGLEPALLIHAQLRLGQVPHVAHGGLHDEPRIQIFLDGLHLRRGFDHHQRPLGHLHSIGVGGSDRRSTPTPPTGLPGLMLTLRVGGSDRRSTPTPPTGRPGAHAHLRSRGSDRRSPALRTGLPDAQRSWRGASLKERLGVAAQGRARSAHPGASSRVPRSRAHRGAPPPGPAPDRSPR